MPDKPPTHTSIHTSIHPHIIYPPIHPSSHPPISNTALPPADAHRKSPSCLPLCFPAVSSPSFISELKPYFTPHPRFRTGANRTAVLTETHAEPCRSWPRHVLLLQPDWLLSAAIVRRSATEHDLPQEQGAPCLLWTQRTAGPASSGPDEARRFHRKVVRHSWNATSASLFVRVGGGVPGAGPGLHARAGGNAASEVAGAPQDRGRCFHPASNGPRVSLPADGIYPTTCSAPDWLRLICSQLRSLDMIRPPGQRTSTRSHCFRNVCVCVCLYLLHIQSTAPRSVAPPWSLRAHCGGAQLFLRLDAVLPQNKGAVFGGSGLGLGLVGRSCKHLFLCVCVCVYS